MSKKLEVLYQEYQKSKKGYSDGGEVEEPSELDKAMKSIRDAFNPPPPKTPHVETRDERNARIRRDNADDFAGKHPIRQGYADGGEVEQDPLLVPPPQKMDLGDIPINAGPVDELPDYTEAEANAKKSVDSSAALGDQLGDDQEPQPEQSSYSKLLASLNPNKRSPASNDQPMNHQHISSDLANAQRERDKNIALQNMEKGSALIGAGLSGTNPDHMLKIIGENDKNSDMPVKKYEEQVQNQQFDADSPMSSAVREYLSKKGFEVPEGSSAADLFKIAPFLQKDSALDASIKKAIMGLQVKQSEGDKNRAQKSEIEARKSLLYGNRTDAMKEGKAKSLSDKEDKDVDNDFTKLEKRLTAETGSSRSAFGKSANVIRSSEAIEALIDQVPDGNLDNRQIKELARSLDSMLSNGAGTVTGSAGLVPSTASGDAAKIEEYLTGLPKGAGQQAFVKRLQDTVRREKAIAAKQVNSTQNKVLSAYSHLKKKAPDRYSDMMKAYGIEPMIPSQSRSTASGDGPAVDADLSKMSPAELKAYIATHGGK